MKDFALEEKQMWVNQREYWTKVEKKLRIKSDIKTIAIEMGFLVTGIVMCLFLLVQ